MDSDSGVSLPVARCPDLDRLGMTEGRRAERAKKLPAAVSRGETR